MALPFVDFVERWKPLTKTGWYWDRTGKFRYDHYDRVYTEGPWVLANPEFECFKFMTLFWHLLTGKKQVHSWCQECWKVVCMPKSLAEMVKVEAWQEESGFHSKCGAERRGAVTKGRLWGAYWYCRGKEEGLERYGHVRAFADEHMEPGTTVLLKRGCTEFEMAVGPSHLYHITDEQMELEEEVERVFVNLPDPDALPKHLKKHTYFIWLHHAADHGDDTYLEFTDGKRFHPELVNYHPDGIPRLDGQEITTLPPKPESEPDLTFDKGEEA